MAWRGTTLLFVCGITDFFLICLLSFLNDNLRRSSVPSVWRWVVWFLFFYLYAPPDDQTPLPLRVCPSVFLLSRKIPIPALSPPTSAVSIHLLPSASAYKIAPFQPLTIQYSHILRYIPSPGPTPFNFAHRRERWDGKKSYTTPPKRPLPQTPLLGFWIFRILFM